VLEIEVQCDHCGRVKSLEMPYRTTRPGTHALALGVDHFNRHGFRVRPDGSHACRWCELRRVLGLNVVAGWVAAAPAAVAVAKYTCLAVIAIARFGWLALDTVTGEPED